MQRRSRADISAGPLQTKALFYLIVLGWCRLHSSVQRFMLITIGRVVKPWGVKGEVKIEPLTDFPDRFGKLERVYLASPAGPIECRIKSVRFRGGAPHIIFEGYETPEKARTLAGWLVQIPSDEAIPLPEGSYYWFELIGMEVFTERGERLGVIDDIFRTGSNDVYVVKKGRKEYYIPATQEVIRGVDRRERRMLIHVIDGLLD